MDDHFVQSSSKLLACNGATVTPYSCNFWGALLGKQTAQGLRYRLAAAAGSLKRSNPGKIPSSYLQCVDVGVILPHHTGLVKRGRHIFFSDAMWFAAPGLRSPAGIPQISISFIALEFRNTTKSKPMIPPQNT